METFALYREVGGSLLFFKKWREYDVFKYNSIKYIHH